jgi:hypothetical protein
MVLFCWDCNRLIQEHYREQEGCDHVEKWYTLHLSQVVVHKGSNKFTLLLDSASYIRKYSVFSLEIVRLSGAYIHKVTEMEELSKEELEHKPGVSMFCI